jgi:hypothetical protein
VHIYSRRYKELLLCEVLINRVINDEKKLKLSYLKVKDIYNVPCNESITFKRDFVFNDIRVKSYLVKHFRKVCSE